METLRITEQEYNQDPEKWKQWERSINWVRYEHNVEQGYYEWTFRETPGEAHNKP